VRFIRLLRSGALGLRVVAARPVMAAITMIGASAHLGRRLRPSDQESYAKLARQYLPKLAQRQFG
jgi:hypothetical protein